MKVYNAMQLKNGAKAEDKHTSYSLTQPLQFLPKKDKNDDWFAWNMDWLELQGIQFLRKNARKLLKNYKLAKGIIDKTDYIVAEDNEDADLIDVLTKEDDSALELKFYPIIPNIINVLTGEFSKRRTKIQFRAVDDLSYNEMLEQKRADIENVLLQEAQQKLMMKMMEMGVDMESEEAQQQLAPENLQTLPQIEEYYSKSYRSVIEEWATHQYNVDSERFKLDELEEMAFRDSLIADREFWHFRFLEDDYDIEVWNPLLTFYQKSPDVRYISDGNHVGKVDLMTVSDAIDRYGYLMTEEQLKSLQEIHPTKSSLYQVNGYQNDGSYYDATRSHEWNTNMPGLAYRQFISNWSNDPASGGDVLSQILNEGDDVALWGQATLLRVSTIYWKTQRKVGHLVSISEEGDIYQAIVDETFKVTEKPIYDTSLNKNKTKENLLYGEHVDWIWINETVGGVKIGPNLPAYWRTNVGHNLNPIYLGIDKPKPGRLPFQFKGSKTLYGCKLPVEGRVFSDRNTRSTSLVDLTKSYQIGYNLVNNQIADILIDELGTIIMFDQNALPRHSMGEDWGKGNYAKAYVAMKDFSMLPLDTTISNTENATNFNHYQVLNMEQSARLMSRVNLANHFKQQAFEAIGINAERLGGPISQETATGVTQALNQSYAQTEVYFTQHSDHLMPRVHQMRTDLAQYYQSKKPSVRLSYTTTEAQKVNFMINGIDLLARDLNVFATTKANHRAILEQLKTMAIQNNTSGASIYDLGNVLKSESIAEVDNILKKAEEKMIKQKQEEMANAAKIEQEKIQAALNEKQMELQHESVENEKERQKDILVAEIRSAGFGAQSDIDQNNVSDFRDAMADIKETTRYREQTNLKREQNQLDNSIKKEKLNIEREKLRTQKEISDTQLQIARENKNKYDVPSKDKEKKK